MVGAAIRRSGGTEAHSLDALEQAVRSYTLALSTPPPQAHPQYDGPSGGREGSTLVVVSSAQQPDDGPPVRVYPPEEALRRATPLLPRERLVLDGVSDGEWQAFREALAEE
jgi:hypothetical protein